MRSLLFLSACCVCLIASIVHAQPNLFEKPPEVSAESQPHIDLFPLPAGRISNPAEASIASPNDPGRPLNLFALNEPATQSPPDQEPADKRPTIYAYGVDYCIPCKVSERQTGTGDKRIRVTWKHDTTGESFPWHIHNHALTHGGYPVYHYPVAGKWRRTNGMKNLDELANLVEQTQSLAGHIATPNDPAR